MKLKTIFTVDYGWALRFLKKRFGQKMRFYWSRLSGRTYWTNPYGVKFGFRTAYHHSLAQGHSDLKHEAPVIKAFAESAKNARLIYDGGGYNGAYGLMAACTNPQASVVIFEPDRENFLQIQDNINLNGLSNCVVKQMAITNYTGTISFTMNGTSGARIGHGPAVPCTSLNDLPKADLIKLDIEGAEADALEHADLSNHPVLFVEEHNWTDHQKLWNSLSRWGYKPNPINNERDGINHLLIAS